MASRDRRAFTLMEMLVVISIIGILAGLLLPALGAAKQHALKKKARLEAGQLEFSLRSYYMDIRDVTWGEVAGYNTSSKGLLDVLKGSNKSKTPYWEYSAKNVDGGGNMVDPWGTQYRIRRCNADNEVSANGETLYRVCAVWSAGPNKKDDGTDEDGDDVCSWK